MNVRQDIQGGTGTELESLLSSEELTSDNEETI